MHGTTAPAACSCLAAHKLGHQRAHGASAGKEMTVTTVGTRDVVVRFQCIADTDRHSFLADADVTHRAGQLVL